MLLRSELAPEPRTRIDIVNETVATYPDEPALDNGAAYVPVDADDPDERATLVFNEANVASVLCKGLSIEPSA